MRGIRRGNREGAVVYLSALSAFVLGLFFCASAQAYTVVQGKPALENQFIAATTNQFSVLLSTNPFFVQTFNIQLLGINPNYNPPPSTLQQALSLGSTVYIYGWADGMDYQQYIDWTQAGAFWVDCSSPSVFSAYGSTASWDSHSCQAALNALYQTIYKIHTSTPVGPSPVPEF